MNSFIARLSSFGDLAHVALRVVLGLELAYHGFGKVTGGFAINFFRSIGIPVAEVTGPFISFLELIGGVALVVGLFTRYAGVLFTLEFLVVLYVRWVTMSKGWVGSEWELLILFAAIFLATNGGGSLSLDKSLRRGDA